MKASTSNFEQFRGRTGRHTLTGFGRAFSKTLPKRALVLEIQRRGLRDMIDTLESQIQKKRRELYASPKDVAIRDTLCVLEGQLGMLKNELPKIRGQTWSEAFTFIARILLNQETFYELRDVTHQIIRHLQCVPDSEVEQSYDQFDYSI